MTAQRWQEPAGSADGMSVDEFSPRVLARLRGHACALLDSAVLLAGERCGLEDVVARCDRLLALHAGGALAGIFGRGDDTGLVRQ